MSCRELIESLRRAGDGKVRGLWQDAESEAGKIRAGIACRIKELRDNGARTRSARESAVMAAAMNEAAQRSRRIRREADKILSDRLYALAAVSLAMLRDERYAALFEKLFFELPSLGWEIVKVDPADVALARKYFPKAEIVPDRAITGGMDASAAGGSIRVVNTFEKRLERAWGELLPALAADVYREVADDGPSDRSR